jgi:uncharacterized protein with von Willebrand factor type A (vWA) domain
VRSAPQTLNLLLSHTHTMRATTFTAHISHPITRSWVFHFHARGISRKRAVRKMRAPSLEQRSHRSVANEHRFFFGINEGRSAHFHITHTCGNCISLYARRARALSPPVLLKHDIGDAHSRHGGCDFLSSGSKFKI